MGPCLIIFLPQLSLFQHHQSSADRGPESGSSEQRLHRYIEMRGSKLENAVTSEAAKKLLSAGDLKLHSPLC